MNKINERFRQFYPVVMDLETAGFDPINNPILEIAACTLKMDEYGLLIPDETIAFNVEPFDGSILDKKALEFNKIDPNAPNRNAVSEKFAVTEIFSFIRKKIKKEECNRAILVAHNAMFDHGFIMHAAQRCEIKRNPFHPFSTFDTATLCGLTFGQTVLAKSCKLANIEFDHKEAHSALYDTKKTAELFCEIINRFKNLGGLDLLKINKNETEELRS